jgi:hypothetical protein
VALFAALDPGQLADPQVAAYYGMILAHAGQAAQAREFLARADRAKLLPEERALVRQAQAKL